MFVVPRSNLAYLNMQEKLQKPAFYILLGEDEATKPQAYIGETENFRERVKDHDSNKPFWQKALIFVSKDADKLLIFCQETRTIAEMLSYMSYSDRTKFRKKYIYPLLDAEIIQMTIPNKPNSRNQKYQLTAKGLELIEHLKRNK